MEIQYTLYLAITLMVAPEKSQGLPIPKKMFFVTGSFERTKGGQALLEIGIKVEF